MADVIFSVTKKVHDGKVKDMTTGGDGLSTSSGTYPETTLTIRIFFLLSLTRTNRTSTSMPSLALFENIMT